MSAVRWGLSVLDWRSHAINEHADHPLGVLKAECGHRRVMSNPDHIGPCPDCDAPDPRP